MDLIDRQKALDAVSCIGDETTITTIGHFTRILRALPSEKPFHNTTMNEVLEYIDDMSEDEWQEFTACLECRGWELQWCGGDFE